MKKYIFSALFLLIASTAFAGYKVTGNLQVTGMAGSGDRCVRTDADGNVSATDADCGTGSGAGVNWEDPATIAALQTNTGWTSDASTKTVSSYNVGIGSATPTAQLNIKDNDTVPFQITNTLAGDMLTVTSVGNVGIGTAVPGAKLQIMSTEGLQLRLGTSGSNLYSLGRNTSNGYFNLADEWNNIRMAVDRTGNVGIGTTAPLAHLQVGHGSPSMALTTGLGSTDALIKGRLEVDSHLYVNGNIGIGTTAPTQLLDVKGTVQATGIKLTTSPTNGYVLTSDANGVGTWQAATGGSGLSGLTAGKVLKASSSTSAVDSSIYENGGNVGIGTTIPISNMDVNGGSSTVVNINARPSSTLEDSYTKLLVNFNGVNGATSYTAETGQTVTFAGTAQISTAKNRYGASSLLLDGNSDSVTVPDSEDFTFGSGDFTIDFNVWFVALPGAGAATTLVGQCNNAATVLDVFQYRGDGGKLKLYASSSGGEISTTSSAGISTGQWYHIAFVRSGSTLYIFVNGTSQPVTVTTALGTFPNSADPFTIGKLQGNDQYLNGYIDSVRVSKGIARWTSDFTPPSVDYAITDVASPYLNFSSNSVLKSSLYIDSSNSNKLKINVPDITRITIDSIGNVGIGTTTPVNKLDVYGGVVIGTPNAGAIIAPTNGLLVSGNVGIGTTASTSNLTLRGTISSNGNVGVSTTATTTCGCKVYTNGLCTTIGTCS